MRERLDPRRPTPRLRSDAVIGEVASAKCGPYHILKRREAGAYLRLSPRERFLATLMTGERTVSEVAVEYFVRYRSRAAEHDPYDGDAQTGLNGW